MKKNIFIIISCLSIFLATGCSGLVKKKISEAEDPNFTFAGFYYTHLGSNEEEAFKFYREFPVKKSMYLIAKEHNIIIDISEYQKFINSNDISGVNVKKGFRKEFFSWTGNSSAANRVYIYFEKDYFNLKDSKVKVSMIINGKNIDLMQSEISEYDTLSRHIEKRFPSGREASAEYDSGGYETADSVPGLILFSGKKPDTVITEKNRKSEIENLIRDYVKDLDREGKDKFRHEMLDLIYKITN